METPIEILKRAVRMERWNEDGDLIRLELLPPMTDAELEKLQSRLPCALPSHIRDLLRFSRGFEGSAADPVDFSGQLPYAHDEIFPYGLPIGGDGFGNFWVVDLSSSSEDFGPVYFACHDPSVIALQSHSLAGFLTDLLLGNSEDENVIDFVHEDATSNIWRTDPLALTRPEALSSTDAELKGFAARLPDGFLVSDLRDADIGDGFPWGRFGPDTRIIRHSDAPLFAYGPAK